MPFPSTTTEVPALVSRMSPSDIEELGPWLYERLSRHYTGLSHQQLLTYLRGCMVDNGHWLVRSGEAAGLARMVREPLVSAPFAQEVFVLCRDGAETEAADIYCAMAKWALNQEASGLDVDRLTDVPRPEITKRLGALKARPAYRVLFR